MKKSVTSTPDPQVNVLVFPSSNEPGLEIIRSLVGQEGLTVYGGSSLPRNTDASASLLDHHRTFPWLHEDSFDQAFQEHILQHAIDLVFPTTEECVRKFSAWTIEGVEFITQSRETAEVVESKRKTYERLGQRVPVPEMYDPDTPRFPAYGKPNLGAGGRGNILIETELDWNFAREQDLLIMEHLPGQEAVAYSLGNRDGQQLLCVTKTMGRWKGGASQRGELKHIPELIEHAAVIGQDLKLVGPWFAQFREDRNGVYRLSDLNARIGGGSGLTRYAGINLPLLTVKLFSGMDAYIPTLYGGPVSWVRNLRPYPVFPPFDRVIWNASSFAQGEPSRAAPHAVTALLSLRNEGVRTEAYGSSIPDALAEWSLERAFEAWHASVQAALASDVSPETTVFVTNDARDQRAINQQSANIRVLDTNSLEALQSSGAHR